MSKDLLNEISAKVQRFKDFAIAKHELGVNIHELLAEYEGCIEEFTEKVKELSVVESTQYNEPDTLKDIRDSRPEGSRQIPFTLSDAELYDKILGGWLGRAAGCLLGIPVEVMTKDYIKNFAAAVGEAYPLNDYWGTLPPHRSPYKKHYGHTRLSDIIRPFIRSMASDDDMMYSVLNLMILEEYGIDFTPDDVGDAWLKYLAQVCTAEKMALRNLRAGLKPPETAIVDNPYWEWIGASIRADTWGWVSPGRPEMAAEMAYKDATVSHIKNGIYGEMFFAAMIAAAFVTSDIRSLVQIGLSEIPARCRLAEAITQTVKWYNELNDWNKTWDKINEAYGHYHAVHTINNACFTILGLLHGEGDFTKTISYTVMAGFDTDCTGATAGSIAGVIYGRKGLPSRWYEPFNDTLESYIIGHPEEKFTELAQRTMAIAKAILCK